MKRLMIGLMLLLSCTFPLLAQDKDIAKGRFGLTFPTTGVIWHLSDRIALLPHAGYSYNWSNSEAASSSSTGHSRSPVVGVDLRIYTNEWKNLSFFLSPKYEFSRSTGYSESNSTSPYSDPTTISGTYSTTTNAHLIAGTFGVQFPINNRVSIFGDIGVSYSRRTLSGSTTSSTSTSSWSDSANNTVGSRGSFGLIVYLK